MNVGGAAIGAGMCIAVVVTAAAAQDLGPNFQKIREGIYVQSAGDVNSTVGIVLTSEGVVVIDTGGQSRPLREGGTRDPCCGRRVSAGHAARRVPGEDDAARR